MAQPQADRTSSLDPLCRPDQSFRQGRVVRSDSLCFNFTQWDTSSGLTAFDRDLVLNRPRQLGLSSLWDAAAKPVRLSRLVPVFALRASGLLTDRSLSCPNLYPNLVALPSFVRAVIATTAALRCGSTSQPHSLTATAFPSAWPPA